MNKETEIDGSRLILLACVTGFTIILMAWFSKKILPEPLSYLELALPPFLATLGEGMLQHEKTRPHVRTWHVIAVVLLSTAAIIGIHWF